MTQITEETTCRCGAYGGSTGTEKNLHTHCAVCGNTTDANGVCRRGISTGRCPDEKAIAIPMPVGGNRRFAIGDRIRVRAERYKRLGGYEATVTDTDSYGVYFTLPSGSRGFVENADVEGVR